MLSKKLFLSSVVLFVLVSLPFVGSVGASSEMWSQTYESVRFGSAYSLVETSDGGYAIVGESGLDSDFCLLKTDEWGNMQWTKTYGGTNDDRAFSVVETSDGGYAIAGYTESFGAGSFDFWLVKTDSNGNMVWNQTYGRKDDEFAYSVVEASDGGYVVAGGSWLVKFDSQGRTEWDQTYSSYFARSVVTTSDGGYAIFGDGLLIKTDEYGYIIWNQTYGGNVLKGYSGSFVATSNGGYAFVIGSRLIKTDAQGNVEWTQTYEMERATSRGLLSLVETSNGGYVLAGHAWFMMSGDHIIWAVKTDAQGIIPEFPSWTILPLLLLTIVVVIVYRKKLYRTQTNIHIRSLITVHC